jgi:hypothetical protein
MRCVIGLLERLGFIGARSGGDSFAAGGSLVRAQ